jgi:pilus assembly protein CpaE
VAGERILFVEDEEMIRKLVGTYLSRAGYQVDFAVDGMDALRKVSEQGNPSLVLTDVNMPNMTGLELTRRLRGHHKTARIPIIMLSALKQAEDMLAGYAEGADDYVPKPIELSILAAKIDSLLKRYSALPHEAATPGRVVAFLHGKGGVGTTTLAVNVAVTLAVPPTRVSLLDLSLEFPTVGVFLNIRPRHTVADFVELSGPIDDDTFAHFVVRHPRSELRVLIGCDITERAELVTVPAVQQAIDKLRGQSDYVFIDQPAAFTERTLTVLDAASVACVVSGANLPSLKASLDCLQVLEKLHFPPERTLLVMNRTTPIGVTLEQAKQFFGRTPDHVLGYSELFDHAANAGEPLVLTHPEYPGTKDVKELGQRLLRAADPGP